MSNQTFLSSLSVTDWFQYCNKVFCPVPLLCSGQLNPAKFCVITSYWAATSALQRQTNIQTETEATRQKIPNIIFNVGFLKPTSQPQIPAMVRFELILNIIINSCRATDKDWPTLTKTEDKLQSKLSHSETFQFLINLCHLTGTD